MFYRKVCYKITLLVTPTRFFFILFCWIREIFQSNFPMSWSLPKQQHSTQVKSQWLKYKVLKTLCKFPCPRAATINLHHSQFTYLLKLCWFLLLFSLGKIYVCRLCLLIECNMDLFCCCCHLHSNRNVQIYVNWFRVDDGNFWTKNNTYVLCIYYVAYTLIQCGKVSFLLHTT